MKTRLLALSSLIALAACQAAPGPRPAPLNAQTASGQTNAQITGLIDDSDIGGVNAQRVAQTKARLQQEAKLVGGELRFATASQRPPVRLQRADLSLSGSLVYIGRGGAKLPGAMATASLYQGERKVASALTDAAGRWQLVAPAPGRYSVRYTLENPRWRISKYSWQGPEADVQGATDFGETMLQSGTANGEAALIHDVFLKTMALFEAEQVPLDWWKRPISVSWPVQGNYYVNYTVNLSGAEQWDVNGHEIGHAIYHQALNARMQGGQHKIDECYGETMALSEGFASFLSGAMHLHKDDPDAHFDKYLVPRRAPIRLENVPDDVCPGQRNEWRVSAAFWEIYDTHADGKDQLSLGLKDIFAALGRRDLPSIGSAAEAYSLLQKALPAEQQAALKDAFVQNTMEVN